jgi:hypothetical protein
MATRIVAVMWTAIWTLMKPTNPAEFWTLVTALATVALTYLAYRGLRSLVLTKSAMLTQATRDARGSAIARCEEFAAEIIAANEPILNGLAANKIPVFVQSAPEVDFDRDDAPRLAKAQAWCNLLPKPLLNDCIRFLNKLEAWAMYFTNGVADHDIAFGPCAPQYCSMIVQNYAVLLTLRVRASAGKYPNAVKLFQGWLAKLEQQAKGLKVDDLLKQLAQAQAKGVKHTLPKPLGTEIDEKGSKR